MQINDFLTYLGHLILIACNPPEWEIVVHINSILFCYICPQKAVKKNVLRKKYVKMFYCDLILLLRQNKSDDQFFNLFELGADLKLTVPRILVPFNKKELVKIQ